jgi:hypothetical protein
MDGTHIRREANLRSVIANSLEPSRLFHEAEEKFSQWALLGLTVFCLRFHHTTGPRIGPGVATHPGSWWKSMLMLPEFHNNTACNIHDAADLALAVEFQAPLSTKVGKDRKSLFPSASTCSHQFRSALWSVSSGFWSLK